MKKIDCLEQIIRQLIGENSLLKDELKKTLKKRQIRSLQIELKHDESTCYVGGSRIFVNVHDIIDCYNITKDWYDCLPVKNTYLIDSKYSDYNETESIRDFVSLYIGDSERLSISNLLDDSDFLKCEKPSMLDTLTVLSLAFLLGHEIGHLVHDDEKRRNSPLANERGADNFSIMVLKELHNNDYLNGAIIGLIHIINAETRHGEYDYDHPHGIERLYSLLYYWGVEDHSPYWELAYKILFIWCKKINLTIDWEKNTSNTYKEKFFDAYIHFKKDPQ